MSTDYVYKQKCYFDHYCFLIQNLKPKTKKYDQKVSPGNIIIQKKKKKKLRMVQISNDSDGSGIITNIHSNWLYISTNATLIINDRFLIQNLKLKINIKYEPTKNPLMVPIKIILLY